MRRARRAARTCAQALDVAGAAELELQQRPVRGCAAAASPIASAVSRLMRVGGGQRLQRREPASRRRGVPERLASRSHSAQSSALRAAPAGIAAADPRGRGRHGPRRCERLERGDHARDRFAVARIGHALAAAAKSAIGDVGDHDLGVLLSREIVNGAASGHDRRITARRWGCGAIWRLSRPADRQSADRRSRQPRCASDRRREG